MSCVTIVPGLVSFDTTLARLSCFPLAERFDFFPRAERALPFHYSLACRRDLPVPSMYGLRAGYATHTGGILYYERKLLAQRLALSCDTENRRFVLTPAMRRLPFPIGGIRPAGEHLFARIALDLFHAGFLVMRGAAWQEGNGAVRAIAMPSMNGKTSLLQTVLARDPAARYVAEDILIARRVGAGLEIFPTAAFRANYGRRINRELHATLRGRMADSGPLLTDRLLIGANSLDPRRQAPDKVIDFALTTGLFFLRDPLVQLELLATGGTANLMDRMQNMFQDIPYKILDIRQYHCRELTQDS